MSFPLKLEGSSFLKLHFQMYGWKYNAKTYKFIKFLQKKHRKNNESVRKYVADKQRNFGRQKR